jgi:hypothetical protein
MKDSIRQFHREESAQVTVLFVFCSLAMVILLGFVLNTVKQTSRKVEMQGAADSGSLAGGIWMARGMNLMTMNNKGMADILSVMIVVHATAQTARIMSTVVVPPMIAAATAAVEVPGDAVILDQLIDEEQFWSTFSGTMADTDNQLSNPDTGSGWQAMNALDVLNQRIKVAFPPAAQTQAIKYAKDNGADQAPWAWLRSGTPGLLPVYPVGRGGYEFIAVEAPRCSLPTLTNVARGGLEAACAAQAGPCITPLIAMGILGPIVDSNVSALEGDAAGKTSGSVGPDSFRTLTDDNGNSLQSMLDQYNQAQQDQAQQNGTSYTPKTIGSFYKGSSWVAGDTLQWPSEPPLPMILTDNPQSAGDAEADPDAEVNLLIVREHLQFLAFAFGKTMPSPVGADRFINPQAASVTYGQTDVYNPKEWSMFNQNWRAKLARATLMSGKWNEAVGTGGLMPAASGTDFSFVNLH